MSRKKKVMGRGKGKTESAQAAFARNRSSVKTGGDGYSTPSFKTQSRATRSKPVPHALRLADAMRASGGHIPESRSLPAKPRSLPKASNKGSTVPKAGSIAPAGNRGNLKGSGYGAR